MMKQYAAILAVLGALLTPLHGFVQPFPRIPAIGSSNQALVPSKLLSPPTTPLFTTGPRTRRSVACFGFNLPPGRNNNNNGLQEILVGVASLVGVLLFLASPLGGLLFAAVNSLLALAFITPLVLILGFNVWRFLNTTLGNCPSCSAPVRVLKDGSPSICFNCGSVIQARSRTGSDIEFAPNVDQFEQDDSFFGGLFGGGSFGGSPTQRRPQQETKEDRYRRERTVIDVDVEDLDNKK